MAVGAFERSYLALEQEQIAVHILNNALGPRKACA